MTPAGAVFMTYVCGALAVLMMFEPVSRSGRELSEGERMRVLGIFAVLWPAYALELLVAAIARRLP